MLIIQDKILINLDNTFSIVVGGQGDRYLIFKGGGGLEKHLVFSDNGSAFKARNIIALNYAHGDKHCYINVLMEEEINLN